MTMTKTHTKTNTKITSGGVVTGMKGGLLLDIRRKHISRRKYHVKGVVTGTFSFYFFSSKKYNSPDK